jgi:glycosyltransferase involved in cell wall biosynthesis
MRVVHVDFGKEWRGGQRQCLLLHQGLLKQGVDSVLICHESGALFGKEAENTVGFPFESELSPWGAMRLSRIIKKLNADIIHSHDAHSLTPLLIVRALRKELKLVHTRRVDFPVKRLLKYNNRFVKLVAISQGVKKILLDCGVTGNIEVIYSGVPVPVFPNEAAVRAEKKSLGIEGDIVFGTTANFAPHKDIPTTLNAFKEYLSGGATGKLLLVGEGKGMPDAVSLAESLGIKERVIFTGFKENVAKYLKCMDVYLATSNAEGLNTSIIDAMHAALPVIASKVGGIPELVTDGANGFLAEPGDYKGFAAAMRKVSENSGLRTAFADASVKKAASFTDLAMVNGYMAFYNRI